MICSLPWYDFDETAELHDQLWTHFNNFYASPLPTYLDRETTLLDSLKSPELFLTQTCGYDIAFDLPNSLSVVATPIYETEGARDGYYSSFLVSRGGKYKNLSEALSRGRFVANDNRSFSGYHCVREIQTPQTLWSGSHIRSIHLVQTGIADWAAIDAITWSLLNKFKPNAIDGLQVFGQSRTALAPPLVTNANRSQQEIRKIQHSLAALSQEQKSRAILSQLAIAGFRWISPNEYKTSFGQAAS